MSQLRIVASQDGAGDGWIAVHLAPEAALVPFVGFSIERLVACGPHRSACADVAVFGGAGGLAEGSGLLVSAGHAFVHGVFGTCLAPSCSPIRPLPSATLLTTLSVALPATVHNIETVCLENAMLQAGAATARVASACTSVTLTRTAGPGGGGNRTGVALVKTCARAARPIYHAPQTHTHAQQHVRM